jgi:hypothetical protein
MQGMPREAGCELLHGRYQINEDIEELHLIRFGAGGSQLRPYGGNTERVQMQLSSLRDPMALD